MEGYDGKVQALGPDEGENRLVKHGSIAKTYWLHGALEIFQAPAFLCIVHFFNQEIQFTGF